MDDAPVSARLGASLRDLAVIAGGLGALTAAGALARRRIAPPAPPLPAFDLLVFAMTVLPTGAYLATGEAGPHQAAWGKRRAGLRVVTAAGGHPGPGRVVLRTAVKLLPWQLAHVAVVRLVRGVDAPVTIWTTDALSLLLAAASVTLALRDPQGRAVHDRVAGTRVVGR
ncbi:MAG TPA: RDD family protein [Pseudonocardia sp.]|nr:RDD family protein [Pseudonocardia sp.]